MDYAQDGDLSAYDHADIADAAMWDGDTDLFVASLLDCGVGDGHGFLEEGYKIHDWYEYAGKLIDKRKADAERKREARRPEGVQAQKEPVQRTSEGHPTPVAGNNTTNLTVPTNSTVPELIPGADAPKTKKAQKKRSPVPTKFELTAKRIAWATSAGFRGDLAHLQITTAQFLDYHAAKGTLNLDWSRAWQTWIRNSVQFGTDMPKPANGRYSEATPRTAESLSNPDVAAKYAAGGKYAFLTKGGENGEK